MPVLKNLESIDREIAKLQKQKESFFKERNKQFNKLSKAKQRVEIAKDVISILNMINVQPGTYFETYEDLVEYDGEGNVTTSQEPQEILQSPEVLNQCNVCALGACFISKVRVANKCDRESLDNAIGDSEKIRSHLSEYFSNKQIELIESAFEQDNFGGVSDDGYDAPYYDYKIGACVAHKDIKRAISFGNRYRSDENRLKAIMENIVKNKGEFKP